MPQGRLGCLRCFVHDRVLNSSSREIKNNTQFSSYIEEKYYYQILVKFPRHSVCNILRLPCKLKLTYFYMKVCLNGCLFSLKWINREENRSR